MASAGSRTGMITAVAVMSIVCVTALVFAFIFSADARKSSNALDDMRKKYNDVVKENALSGADVQALKERRTKEPFQPSDQLLSVAVRDNAEAAKLIGGQSMEAAITSANTAR